MHDRRASLSSKPREGRHPIVLALQIIGWTTLLFFAGYPILHVLFPWLPDPKTY